MNDNQEKKMIQAIIIRPHFRLKSDRIERYIKILCERYIESRNKEGIKRTEFLKTEF